MYVVNPEKISTDRLYLCNEIIANWLIKKNFPLFGKSKDGRFYFAKTDVLLEVLEDLPFYLRISKILR